MHTVELLEEAISTAESLGFHLRYEWLDGIGGGPCKFGGQQIIFVDLALSPREQFEQVLEALREAPNTASLALSASLRQILDLRKSA
jgi:hypothetical protein